MDSFYIKYLMAVYLMFTPSWCKEKLGCFHLTKTEMPGTTQVVLHCEPDEIINITNIEYLLPANMDSYCIGQELCEVSKSNDTCACCQVPKSDKNLCIHPYDMIKTAPLCKSVPGQKCTFKVSRIMFNSSCGLVYKQGSEMYSCGMKDNPYCYSRWVRVIYECLSESITGLPEQSALTVGPDLTVTLRPKQTTIPVTSEGIVGVPGLPGQPGLTVGPDLTVPPKQTTIPVTSKGIVGVPGLPGIPGQTVGPDIKEPLPPKQTKIPVTSTDIVRITGKQVKTDLPGSSDLTTGPHTKQTPIPVTSKSTVGVTVQVTEPTKNNNNSTTTTITIIIILVSSVCPVVLVLILVYCLYLKRKNNRKKLINKQNINSGINRNMELQAENTSVVTSSNGGSAHYNVPAESVKNHPQRLSSIESDYLTPDIYTEIKDMKTASNTMYENITQQMVNVNDNTEETLSNTDYEKPVSMGQKLGLYETLEEMKPDFRGNHETRYQQLVMAPTRKETQ